MREYNTEYMPLSWTYNPYPEALMRTPSTPSEFERADPDNLIILVDEEPDAEARASAPIIRELICHHWHFRHRHEVRDQIRAMLRRLKEIK